jgi:hypothetical protein
LLDRVFILAGQTFVSGARGFAVSAVCAAALHLLPVK